MAIVVERWECVNVTELCFQSSSLCIIQILPRLIKLLMGVKVAGLD